MVKHTKKKIAFIGTCITNSILQQLQCKVCFDLVEIYFDALPWHFVDNVNGFNAMYDGQIKVRKPFQKSCEVIFGNWGGVDPTVDYVLIDLYALMKPMYRMCSDDDSRMAITTITDLMYSEITEQNNFFQAEYISYLYEEKEDYINCSLLNFSEYLLKRFEPSKIVVLRPKISKKYLSVQLHVEDVNTREFERRVRRETILLNYTDRLIELLKECVVVDLPNDIVSDSNCEGGEGGVHYLQGDYRRMADCLLNCLHIDYRNYWEHELSPETLQFAFWVRQDKWLYQILLEEQEKVYGVNILNRRRAWSEAAQINARIEASGVKLVGKTYIPIWVSRKENRILAYWGAGARCKEMFKSWYDMPVKVIIDNDVEKAGKEINGVPVIHSSEIVDWFKYIIIVTCAKAYEVEEQLKELGLQKENDYLLLEEY